MALAGENIAASVPLAPSNALNGTDAVSGSSSSPYTHPAQPICYHVFLSFRGPDTRKTITDHLYAELVRKGIVTFKDDEEIDLGDPISETIREAIQQSLCFVIVLSKEFASSRWCLDELQQILAIKPNRTVIPLFYKVQPGDIGNQQGDVEQAFGKIKEKYQDDQKQVDHWRKALSDVAKTGGVVDVEKEGEAKLVERIATRIWNELCDQLPSNFESLVGEIKSKAERIISLLRIGLDDDDKRFIGIWGMGGIGKTTLGRVVYETAKKKGNFQASCFLPDIREESKKFGFVHLQKKLLSSLNQGIPNDINNGHLRGADIIRSFVCGKKVLIVLDDVSHRNQLDYLARNEEWFGAGSRIIITTRDKHLLTQYKDFYVCKVDMLCDYESLKLLHQKAFKKDKPGEGFSDLSDRVLRYAGGHPMALEVLGSFLCTREQNEWRRTTDTLRQDLNEEILSKLRISYDDLEEKYKTIFLDIACFFNRKKKCEVENVLKICGLDEIVGIKVLHEKSFLHFSQSSQTARESQNRHDNLQNMTVNTKIEKLPYKALEEEASIEYLYMHDLVQEMGRNIVFQESPINAGCRSRLWSLEDIDLVLKENKGTEHIRSVVLETKQDFEADWHPNCFSKMINLRLLVLSKVHLLRKLESLPTALKFLRWDDYAHDCLPSIEKLWNLESLQLCNSKIETLWGKETFLDKLRIINMSGSECLTETPDFSRTPNLEELLLDGCRKLTCVHDSIKKLEKLVKLSLKECVELEVLPTKLKTKNLKEFILMGCRKLRKLPEFGKNMRSLYFIDMSHTRISRIPSSIRYLIKLKILDLWECNELKSLPDDLPPDLIACPRSSPTLRKEIIRLNLRAPCLPERPKALQGPIHIIRDSKDAATIPTWFEQSEYCWGKDTDGPTSGEFVTIAANIPSNVVASDSNEQLWGIAVCLYFKPFSQARKICIDWRFQDKSHISKTKMHGMMLTPDDDNHDWGVYVGFYPFDKEKHLQHQSINLTLSWKTTRTTDRDVGDLVIMGCQWRLASKLEFDEWEERAQSPSGNDSRSWKVGQNNSSAAEWRGEMENSRNSGKGRKQPRGHRKRKEKLKKMD